MKALFTGLAAWLIVVLAPTVNAATPDDLSRTSAYVAALQNPDGGFAAKAGGPSSLGATSSALRILKNTGGTVPDTIAAVKYVKSCFHPDSGGFSQTPGGKPDVGTTASGLMAVAELKVADESLAGAATTYLSANAKTFEEVRIAVAGLEAVNLGVPNDFKRWSEEILKTQNVDGTFGEGDGKARETGGKAVALLRMQVKVPKEDGVIAYLKNAQQPDGGWSKGQGGSDLEATYRIMRYFHMTDVWPDLDRLRSFLESCRHDDGSYGVQPSDPSGGGTYFAMTVSRWARTLNGEPGLVETAGFQPLFNGKTLGGWEGDESLWSARDGMLVGSSKGMRNNNFLAHVKSFDDFVLKLTFQLVNGEGNSGVQFRSVRVPGHEMSGYQADVGQEYWGCLYDESRRNKVLVPASPAALKAVRKTRYNEYVISAKGPHITLSLNGARSVDYHEEDPAIARFGRLAVQLHSGGPTEVRFKDIYLQALPVPKDDSETGPGFHVRTLKTSEAARKYVVYLPRGYDGSKTFPVVLFLHGAGEVGKDGIRQTQSGLGPMIYNNPDAFPAIAVFPQSDTSWRADTESSKAALAALDEVLGSYKADRKRVVLTGLSMGGRGAWELAAAHPDRFAAVVPLCGVGRTETAKTLAALPVWAFSGGDDRAATVVSGRAMVEAINAAGGKARLTEYRGVGHNCWDRAYNDPKLIEWLLAQSRP